MRSRVKKILKSRWFTPIEVLLFIAVCFGIGALFAYFNHALDPSDTAAEYFRAFVSGDYDTMYESLDPKSEYYVDKDTYVSTMQKQRSKYAIDKYEIEDAKKSDGKRYVTVRCIDSVTDESKDFVIYVKGRMSFPRVVPKYYVDISDMVTEDVEISVNDGDVLQINGIDITEDDARVKSDDGITKYTFRGILNGKYELRATSGYASIKQKTRFKGSSDPIDLTSGDYTASIEYEERIKTQGNKVIKRFYSAVRNRDPSSKKLEKCFGPSKKIKKKVEALVEKNEDIVYPPDTRNIDSYKVIEMDVGSPKVKISYDPKKQKYTAKYKYSYDYTSSTDTALYTSYVYQISGTCKAEMTLTYSIKDGDIVITDISITNENKKK